MTTPTGETAGAAILVDERGPYVIEMAVNADERRRRSMAQYWANELSANEGMAICEVPGYIIQFKPNDIGEPRP